MKIYQKIAHVQAVQFVGNVDEIVELVGAKSYSYRFTYAELHVCGPSVDLTMRKGDYVVIQQGSAPYVAPGDVFEKTYREVIQ